MGFFDRLFGRRHREPYGHHPTAQAGAHRGQQPLPDEQAIQRYRYLLRTAPPEQIEQAHAEAFAQLTTDQRQQVLAQLAAAVPTAERPRTDDPATLARVATRAEVRQPGTLERALGGYGPGHGSYGGGYDAGYGGGRSGPGMGGVIGGSLLGTIGGLVIGTAVADALFDTGVGDGGLFGGDDEAMAAGDPGGDTGWAGGDHGGGDFGGGDFGLDFGGGEF